MSIAAGWMAILLALFGTVISIVPGAISVIGLAISMLAVVVSLFSVRKNGKKHFGVTIIIALAGTFVVNDALRIWDPLSLPLKIKIGLYSVELLVLAICTVVAYKLRSTQGNTNTSANSGRPSTNRFD